MDYAARMQTLRHRLRDSGLPLLLVTHLPNIRYLTGFSGSAAILAVWPDKARFWSDGRYREQARIEVRGARVTIPRGSIDAAAAEAIRSARRVGIESGYLSLQRAEQLLGGLRRARAVGNWIEAQRAVKDPAETAAIRSAVELASGVFGRLMRQLRPGMAETEIAGRLEFALRQAGGEGLAFDSIVAAGPNSALPHAHPGKRRLKPHEPLLLDYGVRLAGYCSDMSRTVCLGKAPPRLREIYAAVLESQLAGIAAVRAGVEVAVVDEACRAVLRRARLAKYFVHSTGHGLGLEIHEPPRIAAAGSPRRPARQKPGGPARRRAAAPAAETPPVCLETGQIVTIEPGVYIPGWGGVRIEDVVRVTPRGAEILTPTPKSLIEL